MNGTQTDPSGWMALGLAGRQGVGAGASPGSAEAW
jgi:hypothetical protein